MANLFVQDEAGDARSARRPVTCCVVETVESRCQNPFEAAILVALWAAEVVVAPSMTLYQEARSPVACDAAQGLLEEAVSGDEANGQEAS